MFISKLNEVLTMILNARFAFAVCFLILVALSINSLATAEQSGAAVRVMSFNIRYGSAQDGDNHWDRRKEFLAKTIQAFSPDLLGTQETLGFQKDYLAGQLPGYENLGVGRGDGGTDGEMTALFYRRDRFEKLDGGHFWLSESPDKVGSISWDSSLPRMVTWIKLRDRRDSDLAPIVFFNTHFDHRGVVARKQSAQLLRDKIETLATGCAVVVTGDFNADEGSAPYQTLFGESNAQQSLVIDSFRVLHPTQEKAEGTFSGFKADATAGPRIDWIGLSRDWKILQADIDHTAEAGVTPSDHFPVAAVIERSVKNSQSN